jgi:hypothetical protein
MGPTWTHEDLRSREAEIRHAAERRRREKDERHRDGQGPRTWLRRALSR